MTARESWSACGIANAAACRCGLVHSIESRHMLLFSPLYNNLTWHGVKESSHNINGAKKYYVTIFSNVTGQKSFSAKFHNNKHINNSIKLNFSESRDWVKEKTACQSRNNLKTVAVNKIVKVHVNGFMEACSQVPRWPREIKGRNGVQCRLAKQMAKWVHTTQIGLDLDWGFASPSFIRCTLLPLSVWGIRSPRPTPDGAAGNLSNSYHLHSRSEHADGTTRNKAHGHGELHREVCPRPGIRLACRPAPPRFSSACWQLRWLRRRQHHRFTAATTVTILASRRRQSVGVPSLELQ